MALHSAGAVREKKQTMAELKLRRLTELNARLREDLERPRVKVSEACHSYVCSFFDYCTLPRSFEKIIFIKPFVLALFAQDRVLLIFSPVTSRY